MRHQPLAIVGVGSISALGVSQAEVATAYQAGMPHFGSLDFFGEVTPVSRLSASGEAALSDLINENRSFSELDRSVLMAILCSRGASKQAGWKRGTDSIGVNIGSSRGATSLFEQHHEAFLNSKAHKVSPLTSPTTTLGNLSSWVAQDLGTSGISFSHSITCSTALHGLCNGIAWLKAGMADKFLIGGVEAPLTSFTIAQMRALKLYSVKSQADYPCRPLEDKSSNTLVLGEGGAVFAIERLGEREPIAIVESVGFATEKIDTNTGISKNGEAIQRSMTMALDQMVTDSNVDMIIPHAPGTVDGDLAEMVAIKEVFGSSIPNISSNKWMIGHTFGASGAMSLEYAIWSILNNGFVDFPYPVSISNSRRTIKKVLINAIGFGGNACSVIVSRGS